MLEHPSPSPCGLSSFSWWTSGCHMWGLGRASQGSVWKATEHLDASVPELTQPHFYHVLPAQATHRISSGSRNQEIDSSSFPAVAEKRVFQIYQLQWENINGSMGNPPYYWKIIWAKVDFLESKLQPPRLKRTSSDLWVCVQRWVVGLPWSHTESRLLLKSGWIWKSLERQTQTLDLHPHLRPTE